MFKRYFISFVKFEFEGEEGTGLGPTLEFYSLVAAALQEKSLGIFLCDDDSNEDGGKKVIKFFGFFWSAVDLIER